MVVRVVVFLGLKSLTFVKIMLKYEYVVVYLINRFIFAYHF